MEECRMKYLESIPLEEALARDGIREYKRNIKILKEIISGAFEQQEPADARRVTAGLRRSLWRYQQYIKLYKKALPMYRGKVRNVALKNCSKCPSCGRIFNDKYGFAQYCFSCGQRLK